MARFLLSQNAAYITGTDYKRQWWRDTVTEDRTSQTLGIRRSSSSPGVWPKPSLRETLSELSCQLGFRYEVAVPGIQVAALLHVNLLLKRLHVPAGVDRVVLPGWCQGDLMKAGTALWRAL